jgi:hypothetical protein
MKNTLNFETRATLSLKNNDSAWKKKKAADCRKQNSVKEYTFSQMNNKQIYLLHTICAMEEHISITFSIRTQFHRLTFFTNLTMKSV